MIGQRRPFYDCALLEACFQGRYHTVHQLLARGSKLPALAAAWNGLILGWCGGVWQDNHADRRSALASLRYIVFDLLSAGLEVPTPTEDAEVTAMVERWQIAQRSLTA
jgi:hypothetical protein